MKLGRKQRWFPLHCYGCGDTMDGVSQIDSDVDDAPTKAPQPGCFIVCIYCGAVSVMNADGSARPPSVVEVMEAAADPAVQRAIWSVNYLNRSKQ